jgi:hypothetical protein
MEGVMISDSYSVTQRGTGTQGMNGRFRRNAFLANTALILLCYIWRIFVDSRSSRKLLSGQPYRYGVPELVLPLTKSHRRISTKK